MKEQPAESLDVLMTRLADGDRAVCAEVFRRLWPPLLRMSEGLLRNDADAADATQQALAKIFERASEYDRRRPALPWALAIGAWECRTLRQWRTRRREVSPSIEEPAGRHGEEAAIERDLLQAAVAALGELSEQDRTTLVATFWDEASATGPTFRKRRERAVARLRAAFRRLYGID